MFSENFSRERVRIICTNESVAKLSLSLFRDCFKIRGNLYESEKKNSGAIYTSYKITEPVKKELDTMFSTLGYNPDESAEILKPEVFKCQNCMKSFTRGAFLSCGSVTTPEHSYQLEFSVQNEQLAENLITVLGESGFTPRLSQRKQNHIIYFKESEIIVDLLNYIGAQKSAFRVIDTKILKDIRNNANRLANCDTANIDKVISAAQSQIDSIELLERRGMFNELSRELQETARLRLENPEASLSELAELHDPPITKSGASHRLAKLVKLASE